MKTRFQANVGAVDQWLRLALGFVLLVAAATHRIGPWGWIGVVLLFTAMFRYCPLYGVLGIHTRKRKKAGGTSHR